MLQQQPFSARGTCDQEHMLQPQPFSARGPGRDRQGPIGSNCNEVRENCVGLRDPRIDRAARMKVHSQAIIGTPRDQLGFTGMSWQQAPSSSSSAQPRGSPVPSIRYAHNPKNQTDNYGVPVNQVAISGRRHCPEPDSRAILQEPVFQRHHHAPTPRAPDGKEEENLMQAKRRLGSKPAPRVPYLEQNQQRVESIRTDYGPQSYHTVISEPMAHAFRYNEGQVVQNQREDHVHRVVQKRMQGVTLEDKLMHDRVSNLVFSKEQTEEEDALTVLLSDRSNGKRVYPDARVKLCSVDDLIHGEDMDDSAGRGGDPRFIGWMNGAAGRPALPEPGHEHDEKGPGKRVYPDARVKLCSVDDLIHGEDMDDSAGRQGDPRFIVMMHGAAGQPAFPAPGHEFDEQVNSKRVYPHAAVKMSRVDELIYGHDTDMSNGRVDLFYEGQLHGAAGQRVDEVAAEVGLREGKRIYSNAAVKLSQVDELLFGHDMDDSSGRAQDNGLEVLMQGAAGNRFQPTTDTTYAGDRGKRVIQYHQPSSSGSAVRTDPWNGPPEKPRGQRHYQDQY